MWKKKFTKTFLSRYSLFVTSHPWIVMILSGSIGTALTILALCIADTPDFSNPTEGFATKGTDISGRIMAYSSLIENTGTNKLFYRFPDERKLMISLLRKHNKRSFIPNVNKSNSVNEDYSAVETDDLRIVSDFEDHSFVNYDIARNTFCNRPILSDQFLQFAQLFFFTKDLFSLKTLRALCLAERNFLHGIERFAKNWLPNNCQSSGHKKINQTRCCQSWHLASVASHFAHKSNCSFLNESDAVYIERKITMCWHWKDIIAKSFSGGRSNKDSVRMCSAEVSMVERSPNNIVDIVDECCNHLVYWTYHFLISKDFYDDKIYINASSLDDIDADLERKQYSGYAAIYLPFVATANISEEIPNIVDMILDLQVELGEESILKLDGMYFNLKFYVFHNSLIHDMRFGILAFAAVFICMWFYSSSFVFTICSCISTLLSLGVAYFIYRIVFAIQFFPFVNLLIIVLLIGVGADDVCVLFHVWKNAQTGKNPGVLADVVHETMSHAALSMFVTSFTTAAAFLSNLFSHVTVVRCFGIFAFITILLCYFLVITFMPACLVAIETISFKISFSCCTFRTPNAIYTFKDNLQTFMLYLRQNFSKRNRQLSTCGRVAFEKMLPWLVIKFCWFWIITFTLLSVASAIILFYKPGIELPDKDYFQLLKSDHPIERFESHVNYQFSAYVDQFNRFKLPITVVWGVRPIDNSAYLVPNAKSPLILDSTFAFDNTVDLLWMRDMCYRLHNQSFVSNRLSMPMIVHCFVPDFIDWMQERQCKFDDDICCERNPFQIAQNSVPHCVHKAASGFRNILNAHLLHSGPYFLNGSEKIGALIIQFESTFFFTLSFSDLDKFYQTVNKWLKEELAKAPPHFQNGYFVSTEVAMHLYDLQRALSSDTPISVLIAVAAAFIVLFLSTRNMLLSLLAICCISSIIFVTVGCLILLSWQLNVLESTIIILTVGLSFDFTLHYAVAYRLCTDFGDRESKVVFALSRVGSPIFMSMTTTFLAGMSMLPASTLAYFQIGLFMMLITLISWVYSTLFFNSLLYRFGPVDNLFDLENVIRFILCRRKTTSLANLVAVNENANSLLLEPLNEFQIANKRANLKQAHSLPLLSPTDVPGKQFLPRISNT